MLYRINRLFNVPKRRALVIAILCFLAGSFLLPMGADYVSLLLMFYMFSLIYGLVWFVKYCRDQRLIAEARNAAYQKPEVTMPEMTTPGSSRLFVPNPLDRQ
jgi:hypothetical protein